jgi:hypothetical protein
MLSLFVVLIQRSKRGAPIGVPLQLAAFLQLLITVATQAASLVLLWFSAEAADN